MSMVQGLVDVRQNDTLLWHPSSPSQGSL